MIPWRIREAFRPLLLSAGAFGLRHFGNARAPLQWLHSGWSNEGWSADLDYLEAVRRFASRTGGPILECGSGLTTLVLGIVAPGRTLSLEHTPAWKAHVKATARRYSIPVNVVDAPLRTYDGFDWYTLPESLPEPFELVVCDGPPSATLGGRYGLLPVAARHLAPGATILMDDAERPDEQAIMRRWASDFGVTARDFATGKGKYSVVTSQPQAKSA